MITDLKKHSRHISDKAVVMDAGFASEKNLEFLSGYKYQIDDTGKEKICYVLLKF